jgi:hypothetical protein
MSRVRKRTVNRFTVLIIFVLLEKYDYHPVAVSLKRGLNRMATDVLSVANELRDRGIYRFPDGREFVVCAASDGCGYLIFNSEAWQSYARPEYRSQLNGRILRRGFVTRWRVEDLCDTGRTVKLNQPSSQAA